VPTELAIHLNCCQFSYNFRFIPNEIFTAMEFIRHTLPNGFQVVAEVNPLAHSTALGFFVQTGSRDETDDVSGVSHFLEHMVFKGTPTRTTADVNREFDEMGAHYNAFTSEENTVYYAAVLPEYQTKAVALWADVMRPSLRDEDFDTEKKVILEEIRMYADQPPFGADDRVKANHFGDHPLAKSVLGTELSVGNLPVEKMRAYFEERYSPGNMCLVAAGKVDFDELVRAAAQYCGGWKPFEVHRTTARASGCGKSECVCRDSASMEYVMELANAPGATDPDRYAAKLLATIVGDDSGSRLFWELVDPGHAENASLHHYDYLGTGLFMTYLTCEPDDTPANMQRIREVYRQLHADGVNAHELAQAKSKINSRVVLGSEKPRGRLFTVGANWLNRREYRSVADDLATVDQITVDEINALLLQYPLTKGTGIAVGPLKELLW
jgi:predicted Zn-dependent peptidase